MDSAEWPFADPENVAVITTRQIVREGQPIDRVWHDQDDGQWQFLSSTTAFDMENEMLVSFREIAALDPSVIQLHDLPLGWQAWRSDENETWQRAPIKTG